MMSNTDDDDDQIYESVVSCGELFQQLLTELAQQEGEHYAIVRDHHLRFEHWADFVGALADEQASLDDRLRPYPEVRDLVLQMLLMLYTNLHHALRLELDTTAALESPVHDNKNGTHQAAGQPLEEVLSVEQANNFSASLASKEALNAVQEAVDRLHRLAIIIRRSSTATLDSRVKSFSLKTDATENAEFNRLILLRIKGILPGISESLVGQLLESISYRRLRLIYQWRHQKKLGKRRIERPQHSPPEAPQEEKPTFVPPPTVVGETVNRKTAGKLSVYTKSQGKSGTAHSGLDLPKFQHYQSQEPFIAPDNITVTSASQGYSYPNPPKIPDGARSTQCNWCFEEVLASQLKKPGWWRSHFKRDLPPYVCISEECMDNLIYFPSFKLWRKHMDEAHTVDWVRTIHTPKVWYCDLEPDEYQEFESVEQLRQHITSHHATALTDTQLTRKLTRSVLSSPRKLDICPLCSQNALEVDALQAQTGVEGKKKGKVKKKPKKARFQTSGDDYSSDDETLAQELESQPNEATRDEMSATNRQKVAMHVASHLKSLSLLSIRYMDDESASIKSGNAALGVDDDASDQERLSDTFPLDDGLLNFQDIPLDERLIKELEPSDEDGLGGMFRVEAHDAGYGSEDSEYNSSPRSSARAADYNVFDLEDVYRTLSRNSYSMKNMNDWNYFINNDFALSIIHNATARVPKPTALLCDLCASLDICNPNLNAQYSPNYIRENSKACKLCSLFLGAIGSSYNIDNPAQIITLDRIDSRLRLNFSGPLDPVVFSLCSSALPSVRQISNLEKSEIQLGFPALSEPGSNAHFKLLRTLLNHCGEHHSCVPKVTAHYLPTRLIDVETLRLVITKDISGPVLYVTLSHSWGKEKQLLISHANFERYHQHGFLLEDLPSTTRDAVLITRALGVQFLWANHLCIIQKDKLDRKRESIRIDDTFRNAYCNIAATSARGSHEGFIRPRSPREYVSLPLQDGFSVSVCKFIDDFKADVQKAPLNRSGQSVRERILSRRTIHFAENQFYWQCGHGIYCETLTGLWSPYEAILGDVDFPKNCLQLIKPRFLVYQTLYELLSGTMFRARSKLYEAVALLEGLLAKEFQTTAAYGVFEGDIARGLLWRRARSRIPLPEEDRALPEEDTKLPSWSWMAYSRSILYLDVPEEMDGVSWASIKAPELHGVYRDSRDHKGCLLEIKGLEIELDGLDERRYVPHWDEEQGVRAGGIGIVIGTRKPKGRNYVEYFILTVQPSAVEPGIWRRTGVASLRQPLRTAPDRKLVHITLG